MGHMDTAPDGRMRPAQGGLFPQGPRRSDLFSPYASWLSSGDNAWQMTAATLVGLMSIPALAVLYGGIVQRKWAVNTMLMVFTAFCLTLIVWVLWAFKMGFGTPWISSFVGRTDTVGCSGGGQAPGRLTFLHGAVSE